MDYWQVDVFADRPLAGNGLAVFPDARGLDEHGMIALTRELRQFESVFLIPDNGLDIAARVFTAEEELPFAGHPVLGAAAVLHHLHSAGPTALTRLALRDKTVAVRTRRDGTAFEAEMAQGFVELGPALEQDLVAPLAEAFGVAVDPRFPAKVASTGLPYLLLPVTAASLGGARQRQDVQGMLADIGAAFVYLLDVDGREGRTWDPAGVVEDIATGSAAGPVAGYLIDLGLERQAAAFELRQGQYTGRDSRLRVRADEDGAIHVGGAVQLVAHATLVPGAVPLDGKA